MSRTFTGGWIALCVALATIAGCASRTEVIVAVESDITTLDRLTITVTNPAGTTQTASATFGTGPSDFVRTLGVTYSSGPTGPFVATATGYSGSTLVVTREAIFEFTPGQTRVIHIDLLASCEGVMCGTNMTCGESGCRSAMLQPSEYEPYTGTIATHDAGAATDGNVAVDTGVPCGGPCVLAHSPDATCMGGRCVIGTCDPGFDDCDGRDSNGCEVDLTTDTQNCGRCGMRCFGSARMCCASACHATCP